MAGKYIHPDNCYPSHKKESGDDNAMPKGKYPMPEMNRKESDEQVVKGPKHYRKE